MFEFLYNLIIKPIYILIEFLFNYVYQHSDHLGLTIFLISMFVSIACLPLYLKADELQDEERKIQAKLKDKVDSIKRNYKGDERHFLLQTYYRQNNYHPIMGLRVSLSLLLQIPFFMAAYIFFNKLALPDGTSLGAIIDIMAPDRMISLFNFKINVYPIAMTMVNILASYVYIKDKNNLKEGWNLLIVSLIFLVLLYNCPALLVLYWLYNNLFSLIKNICLLYMSRERLIKYSLGLAFIIFCFLQKSFGIGIDTIIFGFLVLLICYKEAINKSLENFSHYKQLFFLSNLSLVCLIGLLIPTNVIAGSPLDFIFKNAGPLNIAFYTATVYAGIFLFWGSFLFYFANIKIRKILGAVSVFTLLFFITNFLIIKMPTDTITNALVFETSKINFNHYICHPIVYVLITGLLVFIIFATILHKKEKIIKLLAVSTCIVTIILSGSNIFNIKKTLNRYKGDNKKEYTIGQKFIHLSKTKKNVLIIFLDRFVSSYLPITFEEFPELREQFRGFTYYPNTLSYSRHTITGYPPILGGYEYTPHRMDEEKGFFEEKFKRAITVLPAIFTNNDWYANIINPEDLGWTKYTKWGFVSHSEAEALLSDTLYKRFNINYEEIPDNIVPIISNKDNLLSAANTKTNIIYYALIPVSPPSFRKMIYNSGKYYHRKNNKIKTYGTTFLKCFYELESMGLFTDFNSPYNTFTVFNNDLPHSPGFLSYPNYDLSENNDKSYIPKFKLLDKESALMHYHVDTASLKLLGKYFDFLRENRVFDNTRIIIVSDHGFQVPNHTFSEFLLNTYSQVNPLLLVKDFNSTSVFETKQDFMTNADVPVIATENLIKNPTNPYTGKILSNKDKEKGVIVYTGLYWQPKHYVKKTKILGDEHTYNYVKGDPTKEYNWQTKLSKKEAFDKINR